MQKQLLIENRIALSDKGNESHIKGSSEHDETGTIEQIFENNMLAYING